MRKYPNLYFIGGMRCGSTTIHNLLNQHPQINMSEVKEPRFWEAELMRENSSKEIEKFEKSGKYRTYEKYQTLFDWNNTYKYHGESSHYFYKPEIGDLIYKRVPKSKVIISLRNPVDRLISEYKYFYDSGKINQEVDLNSWIKNDLENGGRYRKGLYFERLSCYYKIFGKKNIRVVLFDNLKKDPKKLMSELFSFLQVNQFSITAVHREKSAVRKNVFRNIYINNARILKKIIPKPIIKTFVNQIESRLPVKERKMDEISNELRNDLVSIYKEDIKSTSDLVQMDLNHLWVPK